MSHQAIQVNLEDGMRGDLTVHFRDPDTDPWDARDVAVTVLAGALLIGDITGDGESIRLRILPLDTIREATVIGPVE